MIPHDEILMEMIENVGIITGTKSWEEEGAYSIGHLSKAQLEVIEPYRIAPVTEGTGAEVVEEN